MLRWLGGIEVSDDIPSLTDRSLGEESKPKKSQSETHSLPETTRARVRRRLASIRRGSTHAEVAEYMRLVTAIAAWFGLTLDNMGDPAPQLAKFNALLDVRDVNGRADDKKSAEWNPILRLVDYEAPKWDEFVLSL
jgi:predicted neuraminidase